MVIFKITFVDRKIDRPTAARELFATVVDHHHQRHQSPSCVCSEGGRYFRQKLNRYPLTVSRIRYAVVLVHTHTVYGEGQSL